MTANVTQRWFTYKVYRLKQLLVSDLVRDKTIASIVKMMLRYLFLLLCVVSLGFFAEASKRKLTAPRITCDGRVCMTNHGQSGKFSVSRGNQTEDAPETLTVTFDSIKEVDENGNEVGKSVSKELKHSFNNFAQLDFDFTDVVDTDYQGIKAKAFNFSVEIPGPNAILNVPVYFFTRNGTVDLCDDEQIGILGGVMKYNIELSNWKFCRVGSGCKKGRTEEIGKFVDFVITVKNKGKGKKGRKEKKQAGKKRKAQKFYFGNSTSISFPSGFLSDGNCKEMAAEYPKIEVKRSGEYSIIFRFPLFNDKTAYDPAVSVIESSVPDSVQEVTVAPTTVMTPTTGSSKPWPSLGAVLILGVLMRLFF